MCRLGDRFRKFNKGGEPLLIFILSTASITTFVLMEYYNIFLYLEWKYWRFCYYWYEKIAIYLDSTNLAELLDTYFNIRIPSNEEIDSLTPEEKIIFKRYVKDLASAFLYWYFVAVFITYYSAFFLYNYIFLLLRVLSLIDDESEYDDSVRTFLISLLSFISHFVVTSVMHFFF